jgi:tRNA(His) 5'-end guanylyltransferase
MKKFFVTMWRNLNLTKDGVDGKAFHTLTRTCDRPFDEMFMKMMDETAVYMCKNVQGAQFAFVQSDEISILVTDFDKCTTDAWFDYNVQKMCSIGASLATAKFNSQYRESPNCIGMANFDCRVFVVPDPLKLKTTLYGANKMRQGIVFRW